MIFKVKSCQKMSQILPELVVISACSVPLAAPVSFKDQELGSP